MSASTATTPGASGADGRAATDGAIRPFRIETPDEAVDDLRRRVAAPRWPEKETVADDSQGVPLATIQDLANHWATHYDWRACESEAERPTQPRDGDRRAGRPFHPRSLRARGCSPTYNRLEKGGHFAAWEQPQLFSEEMRASFKSLR